MKSFVNYPFEFNNLLFPQKTPAKNCGKMVAHYELFKKVKHLDGAIVKCGISVEDGLSRFTLLKEIISSPIPQKVIAFQRSKSFLEERVDQNGELVLTVNGRERNTTGKKYNAATTRTKAIKHNVEVVPGTIGDSIPIYLIENPELKIAMLNIDLDDYEDTFTALEFFYPRLVQGGVLIIDNYYKNLDEKTAVDCYFHPTLPKIKSFIVNKGPHYLLKP